MVFEWKLIEIVETKKKVHVIKVKMRTEWFSIEYWFAVFMMIRAIGILFHFGKSENEEEKNIAIEIKKIFLILIMCG